MNNDEAYKHIENSVFKYEEKELSSLEDRKLNNEALNHIREVLKNERPQGEWISKEEALKIMCEKCPVYNCVSGCNSYRSIEKMSSVQSQRPTGDLADEVWKLYEKYHSHLATNVIEFGDELKELLGKYQEGGKE